MAEPAPYGGFIVKTLEEEKEREQKLKDQAVEVQVNNQTEVLRPEALHLRGVDSLSTDDIKAFIDYYVNYITEEVDEAVEGSDVPIKKLQYEQLPLDDQITFRVQWINDSSVNITFKTHEDCRAVLNRIAITSPSEESQLPEVDFTNELYVSNLIQERETKPYNPVIEFRKRQDLLSRIGDPEASKIEDEKNDNDGMDEDEFSLTLYVRQSFQSDRKVKNASAYSRYYLLHGEPERKPPNKNRYRERGSRRPRERRREESEDLFADKMQNFKSRDEEDDLFADKLRDRNRERSPSRT